MRRILALCLVAVATSACLAAQPRVQADRATSTHGGLVSVAAGSYAHGGGIGDLTYVADPAARLCFAYAHVVQGGSTGPGGLVDVDCCRLRYVPEVSAALPDLAATCPVSQATQPAPAAVPPAP
jgi:hypothetical protein